MTNPIPAHSSVIVFLLSLGLCIGCSDRPPDISKAVDAAEESELVPEVPDTVPIVETPGGGWSTMTNASTAVVAEFHTAVALRRERARRTDQLKQVGMAIHNYLTAYKSFPPAQHARDADGNPRLSWRVHILQFIIDQADLYREFQLDEPWDSEHNRQLIGRMPDIYASSGVPRGETVVQAPVGEGTIFGGDHPVTFYGVADGISNTAMLVHVRPERAVTWTAPDDFRFNPERPQEGLDADDKGVAIVGIADGSVYRFPVDLPPRTWLHLFRMNDGQRVQFQQLSSP